MLKPLVSLHIWKGAIREYNAGAAYAALALY